MLDRLVNMLVKDPGFRAALDSIRNLALTAHHIEAHVCPDLGACAKRAQLVAAAREVEG